MGLGGINVQGIRRWGIQDWVVFANIMPTHTRLMPHLATFRSRCFAFEPPLSGSSVLEYCTTRSGDLSVMITSEESA